MYKEACDKLSRELANGNFARHGEVMKVEVKKALESFCKQSEVFCEKVIKGGSFEECMKAVSKNVGSSISDFKAFERAVKYYWPEAEIRFVMEIQSKGEKAAEKQPEAEPAAVPALAAAPKASSTLIDLMDFI